MSEGESFPVDDGDWYHGSPFELTILNVDSTITQDADLARVFSHKPSIVSQNFEDTERHIKHSGGAPGFLYRVVDVLAASDVRPHLNTTMDPGQEWLTNRELRVELIGPTRVRAAELLAPGEVEELRARAALAREERKT